MTMHINSANCVANNGIKTHDIRDRQWVNRGGWLARGGISCILLIVSALSAFTAEAQRVRFLRRQVEIQGTPLQMNLPAGADPVPLPPPQVNTYRITRPDGTQQLEERYDFNELWKQEQRIGQWADPEGIILELAKIIQSAPPPPGHPPHGLRSVFDIWWNSQRNSLFDDRPEALQQWVIDYTGMPGARGRTLPRPPMAIRDLIIYEWDATPHHLAGAFRLNAVATGQSHAGNTWYFFYLKAHPDADPQAMRQEVAERFVTSIRLMPGARVDPPPPVPGTPDAPPTDPDVSAERLAGRRQILDSIRHLTDWQHVETKHYMILANVGPRSRNLISRLESELDDMRQAYAALVPSPRIITEISVIRIFADAAEYARYVGEAHAWTAGLWAPARREMVVRHPQRGLDREGIEQVLRTVRHEAFHQYLFYAFERTTPCAWFNEGHAVFFEYVRPTGNRITVEPHPQYEQIMIRMAEANAIDLQRLLIMDYPTFYNPDDRQRQENYALAWGLIYYLRMAAPMGTTPGIAAIPQTYADALWQSRDGPAATRKTWQSVNVPALTREMNRFWTSSIQRSRARRQRIFDTN